MAGTRRQITWLTGSRALRWGLPVVLLLAGCYSYVSYANLPIPRAVVLECEELRPPFAPGVLLDVRPVKTGG